MANIFSRAAGWLGFKSAESVPVDAKTGMPAGWQNLSLMMGAGGELSARQAWQLYKSVPTLAKVVDLIADQVALITPTLEIDGKPVDDHEVLQLLKSPGFNRTRRQFVKELAVEMLTTGSSNIHVIGNTGALPVALDLFRTMHIVHQDGEDGWPVSFQVSEQRRNMMFQRDGNRDFRYLDGAFGEILPIYDMSGEWKGIGFSRLQAVRSDVELRLRCVLHNRSLIDRGARLSGVLSFKEGLTPDQLAAAEQQVQAKLSGNAGGVLIVGGGESNFDSLTMTPRDMDWSTLTRLVDDAIIARYNVPVTLFNVEAQTNNNYQTAWNMLYDNAVLPVFEVVYEALAHMLAGRLGYDIKFAPDRLGVNVLAAQAVDRNIKLHGSGLVTRNEARHGIGMEPSLGGDEFYISAGLVPAGEDFFTEVDRRLGPDKDEGEGDERSAKPAPKKKPDKDERAERRLN